MRRAAALVALWTLGALAGCTQSSSEAPDLSNLPHLSVTSSAYSEGQAIPSIYTCDGQDRSPPLTIAGWPAQARYLALILEDPDAPSGTWTHWTFWDLPVSKARLPAGADVASLGAIQGTTSAKSPGYHGPCPPSGTHHYVVRAYAIADPLGLKSGASVNDLHRAVATKAIAQGTLTGTYRRGA